MSLFSKKNNGERFGVLIDIGSGSALAAIIHSSEADTSPTIIWHTREHAPLKNIESTAESAKAVTTALMNALLRLDGEGRKAMDAFRKGEKIKEIQCTISAPWSYTVTKNINYKQEEAFQITEALIDELTRTAEEKTANEMEETDSVSQLGLKVVAQTVMSLMANGYVISPSSKGETKELSLVHGSVVTQQYLVDSLQDIKSKLFPEATLKTLSYVMTIYCVSRDLFPHLTEACLVDVTYEATEIGIVREGSLQYSTHTPFGLFSLAREIAEITKVPAHEAFKYLHSETPYSFTETLTESRKAEIETMFEAYIERLSTLFHETGDELSIPKQLVVNTEAGTEAIMKDLLDKAAKRATKSSPGITMITSKLLTKKDTANAENVTADTAMLVGARFFHKQNHCISFDYL